MSYITKRNYSKRSEYSVVYNNFKGVDFSDSGSDVSRSRFAYLENMYRDYEGDAGMIESIPGYRKIYDTLAKPLGLYSYKNSDGEDIIVLHAENMLFQMPVMETENPLNVRVTGGVGANEGDAYRTKDALFVLDGKSIFKLSKEFSGKVTDENTGIYVPTTHVNGEELEQRNLLTRSFYEKYTLSSADAMSFGTPSLIYSITDEEKKECSVIGIIGNETEVYIPSRVLLGDTYYSVKSIETYAFKENTNITECYVAEGVTTIGIGAFLKCYSLKKVVTPNTITEIKDSCFMDCEALNSLHLGSGLKILGQSFISTCPSLRTITYAASSNDFNKIVNVSATVNHIIYYNIKMRSLKIGLKIHNPAISVTSVTCDGEELDFSEILSGDICTDVIVDLEDKSIYNGKTFILKGVMSSNKKDYENYQGFVSSGYSGNKEIYNVITMCRISESFDGRIFLTGNPLYPGYCFYSSLDLTGENNPLYFGEMNYFKDGVGNFANTALLAAGDSLAVFKEGDDGGGSIYYHSPESTGISIIPKIYPTTYVHTGFVARGKAISFFDDPVFVSSKGISALAKKNINLERSIETRSSNVNNRLLSEDLKNVKLTVWNGYLVVLAGENIYLADSRSKFTSETGETEYEWYYISGVGAWRNDSSLFKYSAAAHDGFAVHEMKESAVTGQNVYSMMIGGELVYYTVENGVEYEVHTTGERCGGDFSPASHIMALGDRLIFASCDGQIMIFNTDKKGVAPPEIQALDNFNAEEYKSAWGRAIHPYYYSFAGHPIRYALQTKRDDCSIPHLLKSTVKGSLAVKCKAVSGGKIICEVGTDNGGYKEITRFPNGELFFADIDFSNLSLSTDSIFTIPIHEKEKGWIDKQITLYSNEFNSPFAVYTIAYRFYVKGKIKRNR